MAGAKPPFQRFHELFSVAQNGCWEWTGHIGSNGYGQIKAFGRMVSAHVFAFTLYKGPVPDKLQVLHSCDNKRCVNPYHLSAGTHQRNMQEAAERGRMCAGSRHPHYGRKNPRPKQAHRVRVLGAEYTSQNEAERVLGLGSGTVRYWLMKHPHKAQIISKGEN